MQYGTRQIKVILLFLLLTNGLGHAQRAEIDSISNILTEKKRFSNTYQKDTSYINSLNTLAYEYIPVHIDSTYVLANRALKLSEAMRFNNGIARALLHIGIYYSETGESDKALETYTNAWQNAKTDSNPDLLFDIKNNQGIEYYLRGEFDKALRMHLESLELPQINKMPKNISTANTNIANLFDVQNEHLVALPYYEQALIAAKKSKNPYTIGVAMTNIADDYVESGQTEKAAKHLEETKTYLKAHGYNFFLGQLYLFEATFFHNTKKYDLAYNAMLNSIDLMTDSNNSQINFAVRYQRMADILLKQKKFQEALKYANKAYKIAKSANDLKALSTSSETLYNYHKSIGSVDETLVYLEEFKKYSDSLFNNQNKNGILLLKAKSDFEKKQAELQAENERILLAKQNNSNTSLLVIIILLCTLIPLYLKHHKLGFLNRKIIEKSQLLEHREKELIKSNNTKDRLFSIIGHDLKGPIDSLRILLNMHQKQEVTDLEFLEFSPKLNKDVGSVFFTLTNLLNWGKSQMGGQIHQKKNFEVKPLVTDVIRFLEASSDAKQLKVRNEIEHGAAVYADRDQMDVVIRNILSNAIKFTPPLGTIKVISQDFKHQYRVSIIDNGIGMDKITSKKVLDPHQTYSTYGTANEKGTGLGLSLCRELVENNKGEIWIESTLGKGSSFHVLLPKTKGATKILKAV